MSDVVVVTGEGGSSPEETPLVENETVEVAAEAAVEVAQIEAERDIAIAEIRAETAVAMEAEVTERQEAALEFNAQVELEECRTRIASLEATNLQLQSTLEVLTAGLHQKSPSESESVEQTQASPVPEEAEPPAEPVKAKRKSRWI